MRLLFLLIVTKIRKLSILTVLVKLSRKTSLKMYH